MPSFYVVCMSSRANAMIELVCCDDCVDDGDVDELLLFGVLSAVGDRARLFFFGVRERARPGLS